MISPAAIGALGNCYAALGQKEKAATTLEEAASAADNNTLSPTFLIQAGQIYEDLGQKEKALACYEKVKESYKQSVQTNEVDKYIERLE
jgi:tetratricopeptide (TPR) repeat protein